MLKQSKREYTAPDVRTLQVSVENGYALSVSGGGTTLQGLGGGTEALSGYGNGFDGDSFN